MTLVTLVAFVAFALVIAGVIMAIRDIFFPKSRDAINQRIKEDGSEGGVSRLPVALDDELARGASGQFNQSFNRLIMETGLEIGPLTAMMLMLTCGVLVGGMVWLWKLNELGAAAGLLLGSFLPYLYFIIRRNRRRRAMHEQLPDVLDLLARGVRAGESLDQAISLAGEDAPAPLGIEFRRCARQLEMGLSVTATMRSFTGRVPLMESRILASSLMVQRTSGGNLAVTLERLAAVVRDRLSYRRQFRATTASGRFSGVMIAMVGPLVLLLLAIWQPDYVQNFFRQPIGWGMIAIALGLNLIGVIWLFSLLRNDY